MTTGSGNRGGGVEHVLPCSISFVKYFLELSTTNGPDRLSHLLTNEVAK